MKTFYDKVYKFKCENCLQYHSSMLLYLLVEGKRGVIMNYDTLTEEFMKATFLKRPMMKKVNDLSRGEIGTMLFLGVEKDNALAGEISARLNLTSGRLASVLKSLVKKEYITRRKCENDGRQTIVSLTEKGREFITEDKKIVFDRIKNMFLFLGEEDAKAFVRINVRLINEFNEDENYDKTQ